MSSIDLRRIGGALARFWAGGGGPTRAQIQSVLMVAGYAGEDDGNKQQLVQKAITTSDDATAKLIIEELLSLLWEQGYIGESTVSDEEDRLRQAVEAGGSILTGLGSLVWGSSPSDSRSSTAPFAIRNLPSALGPDLTSQGVVRSDEPAGGRDYDVFICHATEDKPSVVDPLASLLTARGLRVWLDRMEILIGDSLAKKIDDGLANSRFGAVIVSPAVLRKETTWVRRELDALAAREANEGQVVVLPIWHEVGYKEVSMYSPTLASKLAAQTHDGIDLVAEMISRRFGAHSDGRGFASDMAPTTERTSRPRPMPFAGPHSLMSPGMSNEWPPLLLRAVVSYSPEPHAITPKIDSKVHRALPGVLERSAMSSDAAERWGIRAGQYSTTVMTQYTSVLGRSRIAQCSLSLPSTMTNSIKVIIDLGLADESWPLSLVDATILWGDTLSTAILVGREVVEAMTSPSPIPEAVELHAELAPWTGAEPPRHQELAEAIDFSMLGPTTGQSFRAAMWSDWADDVIDRPVLETLIRAWAEVVPDWGFLDPDDGLASLASQLGGHA